ncbi:MAG: nicotinamide riboside transporter PnuC [Opitutus sp.]
MAIDPATATLPSTPAAEQVTAFAAALTPFEVGVMTVVSVLVVAASYAGWWSISETEAWGFATGGVCVWLVVREHLWNWPIGLANNVVFFVLFFKSALYADMGLQTVYFALGVFGWLNWRRGCAQRAGLPISRASRGDWIVVAVAIPLGTWVLREILIKVNGAAPFWDSLTTVLSLVAQYLLCRKRIENWLLWIVADLIYVPLYVARALPLTAVLYGVFLVMCLFGIRQWNRTYQLNAHRP